MKLNFKIFAFLLIIIPSVKCNSSKKNITDTNDAMTSKKTDATLTGTYWKLIELKGKPVGITPVDNKEIHIKFILEGNKVEGFGGCNGFGGKYMTANDFNISITNIISTMIACPDLGTENELFNVLKTPDNYYVKGDTLFLNKARMATMAKFAKR